MDPALGKWVLSSFGAETKTGNSKNTLSLKILVGLLVKGREDLKAKTHSAGADAQLHRLLLIEIVKLARERS